MVRSFVSYLVDDVPLSSEELGTFVVVIYLVFALFPPVVMLISATLKYLTKLSFFDSIIEWCMYLPTTGVIERICVSMIKYFNNDNNQRSATEIPKDERVYRINENIITTANARRLRYFGVGLFSLQAFIITIVILDKLFILEQSVETCETYQRLFEGNPIYDKGCSLRPKLAPNIPASEFFNPINAFGSNALPSLKTNVSGYCQNSSILQNETLSTDYGIKCIKYFFKWSNIIDTLTNALQWHQITVFIFKTILYFTFKWQSTVRRTRWWSETSMSRRLIILVLLTAIWTAISITYLLIIIAFFKVLLSTELILPVQTLVVLLVPLFFIPLPFLNALTVFHWTIRTIRKKDCEQETSDTFGAYRNILIYAKDNEDQ